MKHLFKPILAASLALASPVAAQAPVATFPVYEVNVVRVVDGDTVVVNVPAWAATPFATIAVRIYGIDTPEKHRPLAKCQSEIALGLAATAFAKTLVQAGEPVALVYRGLDKYGGRIDGSLTLPDGQDWATVLINNGMARPYYGKTKSSWCPKRK